MNMNRKEFIKILWFKIFKPLLLLGVLIFSLRFLLRIFTQNGIERGILKFFLWFAILSTLLYLLGFILKKTINYVKSRLSEKSLQFIKIIEKILEYILPIALGMLIYKFWQEGNISAIGFFVAFLIFRIIEKVRKEKMATTKNIEQLTDSTENKDDSNK